jgi:hypothetical protein
MTTTSATQILAAAACALALATATAPAAVGGILFSYDSSTGQLPTEQGWLAYEIDSEGPLTAPNTIGAAADFANATIEDVDGTPTLHIRDTLSDAAFDLPNFAYAWTPAQQQALLAHGLKFTMVYQGLTTTSSGKGNIRFGFNETEFEIQAANIGADRAIEVVGLSAELASPGSFSTLVITGEMNAGNFELAYSFNGGAAVPLSIITNPSPAAIESAVYFGASSSGNRGTDILVRSVVMETLNVPEPTAASLMAFGLLTLAGKRKFG